MKTLKIVIQVELKGDEGDEEQLKQDLYDHVQELIDEDSLEFTVVDESEDDDDF